MKAEDYEKFKNDQMLLSPEALERKKKISRMTIRSKAAKTIERISQRFQTEVFYALRNQLERYLNSKQHWEEQ